MSEGQEPAGPRWTPARVGVVLALAVAMVVGLVLLNRHKGRASDAGDAAPTAVPTSEQVQYRLWGTATGADLTMSVGGQITQATGRAVPLMGKDGTQGISFDAPVGASLYFSAQNTGAVGDLTCEILVDGKAVAHNTSSGGYAIVQCSS